MISSQYSAAMPVTRATASTDSSLGMKAAAAMKAAYMRKTRTGVREVRVRMIPMVPTVMRMETKGENLSVTRNSRTAYPVNPRIRPGSPSRYSMKAREQYTSIVPMSGSRAISPTGTMMMAATFRKSAVRVRLKP